MMVDDHDDDDDGGVVLSSFIIISVSATTPSTMMMHMLVIAVTVLVISTRTRAFAPTTSPRHRRHQLRSFFFLAAADVTTVDKTPFTDTASSTEKDDIDDENAFHLIASTAAACLLQSDLRRDAMGGGEPGKTQASSSATNWINDASAFALQKAIDKIELKLADERTGLDRDEASTWIRWIKSAPTPLIVDLSPNLREIANHDNIGCFSGIYWIPPETSFSIAWGVACCYFRRVPH